MVRRRRLAAILVTTSALVLAVGTAGSATGDTRAATGPESLTFAPALLFSMGNPDVDPPGANDWSCATTARHPRPVVLVHGTWENRYNNFAKLAPALKRDGYCVFALDYGDAGGGAIGQAPSVKGYGDIRDSAGELAGFVDEVLTATGSEQVDIVGHSQGGMMARQYLKFDGGADPGDPPGNKVRKIVSLGATHHGTTLSGIATLSGTLGVLGYADLLLGPAAEQQVVGSEFVTALNAGGDTLPGMEYLAIATRYDEVTTPYESAFLTAGPDAEVRNVTLQDGCPIDLSDHLSMTYSPRAIGLVLEGLDELAPPAPCLPNLPVL